MDDSIGEAPYTRRWPTATESVVVLLALGVLFCLLMPAANQTRGPSFRTQCLNNQRNIAFATMQFDAYHFRLPGWAEPMVPWEKEAAPLPISWVFPILPYLERGDMVQRATKVGGPDYNKNPRDWPPSLAPTERPDLRIMVCPIDSTAVNKGMNISYVANAGYRDEAAERIGSGAGGHPSYDGPEQDGPASAVFLNRYRNAASTRMQSQSLSWISGKDGAANTLMFSENVHAGRWDLECDHGLVGQPREGSVTFHFANSLDDGPRNQLRINAAKGFPPVANEGMYPGANSFHPGGVVAAFCDGHTVFISQDIDWKVWTLLFTPDGDGLRTTWPDGVGAANVFQGMVLTERF